jgi:hypothetical protein
MKFFLLLGGFVGFVLAFAASWNAGNSAAQALRDAAIGCLAGAILFRGLHVVFCITIRNHLAREIVRVRAEVAASGNAEATT